MLDELRGSFAPIPVVLGAFKSAERDYRTLREPYAGSLSYLSPDYYGVELAQQ